ncbi:hypothetical protein [Solwaraspora sp. WMMA2065]|uniref:hypothetical protein n=1 Tax=Solwaraspora sp. WMMA2065 TaxID=3015166 RepID=UPI00259B5114|nr:hypothetical protein [Solwaraspora sp. WMMA2065]WJK37154.1 hypothetical protein O7610_12845 [Solwaraspora sp. WMMA2065]
MVAAAREAARGVVALVALPELLAFDVVSDAFFARSRRRFAGAGHLAFGDRRAGAGTRMTPVVLTAASMAVEHLIRVGHQDGGRISERDCAEIRRIVGDVARDAGVEGTTATRIAEALIETLRDDS